MHKECQLTFHPVVVVVVVGGGSDGDDNENNKDDLTVNRYAKFDNLSPYCI
jgi:hypothetical protein